MTVPGVSPIAALAFKAAVDDPAGFTRPRTVAARFRLTPRRCQPDEHDNPDRICRTGERDVSTTLLAAGQTMYSDRFSRSRFGAQVLDCRGSANRAFPPVRMD